MEVDNMHIYDIYAHIVCVEEHSSELTQEVATFPHLLQLLKQSVDIDAIEVWGEHAALSYSRCV